MKVNIDQRKRDEDAEEMWGPFAEVTVTKVPLIQQVRIRVARVLYDAETEITYALRTGRFKDRPSGPER